MSIKDLLGDSISDEMTVEELIAKIDGLGLVDPSTLPKTVNKDQFDKTASELAQMKRKLKEYEEERLTEAEKLAKAQEEAQAELKRYQRMSRSAIAREKLAEAGYANSEFAELIVNSAQFESDDALMGVVNGLIKVLNDTKSATSKAVKQELLQSTPEPPSGDKPDMKSKFDQMSLSEKMAFKESNPDEYSAITGG